MNVNEEIDNPKSVADTTPGHADPKHAPAVDSAANPQNLPGETPPSNTKSDQETGRPHATTGMLEQILHLLHENRDQTNQLGMELAQLRDMTQQQMQHAKESFESGVQEQKRMTEGAMHSNQDMIHHLSDLVKSAVHSNQEIMHPLSDLANRFNHAASQSVDALKGSAHETSDTLAKIKSNYSSLIEHAGQHFRNIEEKMTDMTTRVKDEAVDKTRSDIIQDVLIPVYDNIYQTYSGCEERGDLHNAERLSKILELLEYKLTHEFNVNTIHPHPGEMFAGDIMTVERAEKSGLINRKNGTVATAIIPGFIREQNGDMQVLRKAKVVLYRNKPDAPHA